jgi:aspartokinase-like uncharacterized kinase
MSPTKIMEIETSANKKTKVLIGPGKLLDQTDELPHY